MSAEACTAWCWRILTMRFFCQRAMREDVWCRRDYLQGLWNYLNHVGVEEGAANSKSQLGGRWWGRGAVVSINIGKPPSWFAASVARMLGPPLISDLLIVIRRRHKGGQVVPDDGEIVPYGRRHAVKVDLVDLCDRLWGMCCRSGSPYLRGRSDDSEEDICVVSVCQK